MKELVTIGVSWDGVRLRVKLTYGNGWSDWVEYPLPHHLTRTLRTSEPPFAERGWIADALFDMVGEIHTRMGWAEERSAADDLAAIGLTLFDQLPGEAG
jgi:hypothetical protein